MNPICKDLPDECWELIFNKLDHHSHFESLSLVSKRFLSLTNRLRHRLNVVDSTYLFHGTISKLIHRFPYLKTLDLSKLFHCDCDLDVVLCEISPSSMLNLEVLDISYHKCIPVQGLRHFGSNNLKVLKCAYLLSLSNSDLMVIADSFPLLEEIDISYIDDIVSFMDDGIEVLSSRLKNLGKVNISGNNFLTDESVKTLSMNCLFLREIAILNCSLITRNGVHFMLNHSPHLSVISTSGNDVTSGPLIVKSATFGRALSTLNFHGSNISDEFLRSVAKASIPLRSISLYACKGHTMDGIRFLLYTYQSLEFLDLSANKFLTDQSIIDLYPYLHVLVVIKLDFCSNLTESTLSNLAKYCPYLEDITMQRVNLTKEGSSMELVENPRIKYLVLAWNSNLGDECLTKIALASPNLEVLNIRSCTGITDGCMTEILRNCQEIRHLCMDDCTRVKNLGLSGELPKLEVLLVARSGFNDDGLLTVGKSCSGLVKLSVDGCAVVTTEGVKETVSQCERLKEINMRGCCEMDEAFIHWMLFSRPSLKKIIGGCYNFTREDNQRLLLQHGCQIR